MAQNTPDRTLITSTPIHHLAPRLASGEISPTTLVEACLDRIARYDERLHAFVEVYREQALAAAEGAGRSLAAGHCLGPLHGIPIALKDLCEIEGRITTAGSLTRRNHIPTATATVVNRLRAAGMIMLGKTHMVEFALGGWGTNQAMGTPWNPWDTTRHRVPGGSSSGSGVAVAAGMAPAALGSDTGGSVRIPAAFCGLVGLKVTAGRISNHGVVPLNALLDTIGPMTRSVEDAALLFRVLHGPDVADPATLGHPPIDPLPVLKAGVHGIRLACVDDTMLAEAEVAPAVADRFRGAVKVLTGLGARVETVSLDRSFTDIQRQTGILIVAEGYQIHRDILEKEGQPFDPGVHGRLLSGKDISAADYIETLKLQERTRAEMADFLRDYDALLLPTTPLTALPLEDVDESAVPHSRLTRMANYLGLCGLAVPSGCDEEGLPTSLQIVGKPFCEATVLRIGWAYEQARSAFPSVPDLSAFDD
jgi:aspartyl-tRNA(Asn)/glutamyl-tRNA(Gln) amidotransferase subunit A